MIVKYLDGQRYGVRYLNWLVLLVPEPVRYQIVVYVSKIIDDYLRKITSLNHCNCGSFNARIQFDIFYIVMYCFWSRITSVLVGITNFFCRG